MNENFRQALQNELIKRTKKNPLFSLRAFAKQLKIEPSTLSQILSGKRKLTDQMCERLGSQLGYGPLKIHTLIKKKEPNSSPFKKLHKLNEDAFKVISDWHYYAILELTHCQDFQGKTQWIAKALGLSFAEALDAIERLKRLNYLEITPEGKWIDRLGDSINLGNEFKAPAFTEHQRQVLNKAVEALSKTPYEERIQSSLTMAISKEKAKEAKQMVLQFLDELNEFLKSDSKKEEVYKVSFSLFPVSNIQAGADHD